MANARVVVKGLWKVKPNHLRTDEQFEIALGGLEFEYSQQLNTRKTTQQVPR